MGIWQDDINEAEANAKTGNGDTEAAHMLLNLFASLAEDPDPDNPPHPDLVRHVARCLVRWSGSGFATDEARGAFLLSGNVGRPKAAMVISDRNRNAMFDYANARAQGMGVSAALEYAAPRNGTNAEALRKVRERNAEMFDWAVRCAGVKKGDGQIK